MTEYTDQYFEGERPLFAEHDAVITGTTFGEGESPLKEGRNITMKNSLFTWKYPLWYCKHVDVDNTIFETMSRSGIWYTSDIKITNSTIQAPKQFRYGDHISLDNVYFSDAEETLWKCSDIRLTNVQARGDYFGMNSNNIYLDHFNLVGNYVFDGGENIEVHNSTLVSKDAFWNCKNVTIYDSVISGEYFGWNTKNLTLVNCTITSDQGLCYIDNLKMVNCRLLQTDLCFEYCSNVDAEITNTITSVKNPISGTIHAHAIDTIIMDSTKIDPAKTEIVTDTGISRKKGA